MGVHGGPDIITDGLVLSLDAADKNSYPGSGTTWSDLSGNNLNGTITNATFSSTAGGGTLVFDGSGDSVSLPASSILDVTDLTICSWNYSTEYDADMFMFEKTTNGVVNTQYSLFFYSGGTNTHIIFRTYGLSAVDLSAVDHANAPVDGQWNHIVATYDAVADVKKIYCNGVEIASASSITGTLVTNPAGTSIIGTYGGGSGYPFDGNIAITMVYNKALSAKEVSQNFNAQRSRFGA